MPNAAFATGFLTSIYTNQQNERKRRDDNAMFAANALIASGRLKNFADLQPLLGDLFQPAGKGSGASKKGKGGQGNDPASILSQIMDPALAGAKPGGAAQHGVYSEDEMRSRQTEDNQTTLNQNFEQQRRVQKEIVGPEKRAEEDAAIKRAEITAGGRGVKWIAGTTKGANLPQEAQDLYGNPLDPAKDYKQGQAPDGSPVFVPIEVKETGPLAERKRQLIASGIPADRANGIAATQLSNERRTLQQNASVRLGAYLESSRASLLTNQERYAEMQQTFPYLLATKIAGADTAEYRAIIESYKKETTKDAYFGSDPKATQRAQKAASDLVKAATKAAATLSAKKSTVLQSLGWEDDEATIRRNLIQEMSGGQDPATVEALASAAVTAPTTPTLPTKTPQPAANPYR